MPTYSMPTVNRSKEWRYWEQYYKAKGCSASKIRKLSCKRMGYR